MFAASVGDMNRLAVVTGIMNNVVVAWPDGVADPMMSRSTIAPSRRFACGKTSSTTGWKPA